MFLFQQLTKDTQMHCRRVSELAVKLAVLCGEPVENQTKISVAAIYHDIGKIKLPEEILNKKEPLTDEEYNLIKQHTNFGSVLMKGYCSDDMCRSSRPPWKRRSRHKPSSRRQIPRHSGYNCRPGWADRHWA